MSEKIKRRWVYIGQPSMYDIDGCDCGNKECQWSEFVDELWCEKCQKDFTPKHWGVFDGPIPMGAANLLGIDFTRVNIKTGRYARCDTKKFMVTRP